jgi:hypothetical protein
MSRYQVRWRDEAGNLHDEGEPFLLRADADDLRIDMEDRPEVESAWVDEVFREDS